VLGVVAVTGYFSKNQAGVGVEGLLHHNINTNYFNYARQRREQKLC